MQFVPLLILAVAISVTLFFAFKRNGKNGGWYFVAAIPALLVGLMLVFSMAFPHAEISLITR